MRSFKNFTVQVYKDSIRRSGKIVVQRMISLSFSEPSVDLPKSPTLFGYQETLGLPSMSFFMDYDTEYKPFIRGDISALADIGHHLHRESEDTLMFYHMEIPKESNGKLSIAYARLFVPWIIQRDSLSFLDMLYDLIPDDCTTRFEFPISMERRERWLSLYGVGTGSCDLVFGSGAQEKFDLAQKTEDKTFAEQFECLKTITVNTTRQKSESGTLRIYLDSAGFYFDILTPAGRRYMNGGLIKHEVGWSIHT